MNYRILAVIATFAFSGCVSTAQDYAITPTPKLCIDYLNAGSLNFNQRAREEALALRGEDCADFVSIAAQIKNSRRASDGAASQRLMQSGQILMQQGAPRTLGN